MRAPFESKSLADANLEQPLRAVIWAAIATENADRMIEDTATTEMTATKEAAGDHLMTDTLIVTDVMSDLTMTVATIVAMTEAMTVEAMTDHVGMTIVDRTAQVVTLLRTVEIVDLLPDINCSHLLQRDISH